MTDLEIIRELRSMGAVRVQIGTVCVEFVALPDLPEQSNVPRTPAVSRDDQYVLDAIRSAT